MQGRKSRGTDFRHSRHHRKHIVRLKDLEAEVKKKNLDIVDIVDRPRSSRKQLDGVNF